MPHVMVHFDPLRVSQPVIDKLKGSLQGIVAQALTQGFSEDSLTKPESIYVRQVASHPTDVNPAPIEIEIQAGRKRDRNEQVVNASIVHGLWRAAVIPADLMAGGECCLWLRFSENNDFRLINSDWQDAT